MDATNPSPEPNRTGNPLAIWRLPLCFITEPFTGGAQEQEPKMVSRVRRRQWSVRGATKARMAKEFQVKGGNVGNIVNAWIGSKGESFEEITLQ